MAEIVFPGAELGISEEFVAGPGTFEEKGRIYSLFWGELERDGKARKVSVRGRRVVRPLKPGDFVYAVVHQLYEAMTMVKFAPVLQGNERPANGDTAFIRISELQNGYVERLRDCVRVGDVLKARVAQISPLATYLSIKDRELGVLKALCSLCRAEMELQGRVFACPSCGSREERKIPSSGDAEERGLDDSSEGSGGYGRGERARGGYGRDGGGFEKRGGYGRRDGGGFGGEGHGGGQGSGEGRGEGRGSRGEGFREGRGFGREGRGGVQGSGEGREFGRRGGGRRGSQF